MSDVDTTGDGDHRTGRGRAVSSRSIDGTSILERVADEQTIHVADLARELGVSEMTIRRDIRRLERDGFLRQTYGGADRPPDPIPGRGLQRASAAARAREAPDRDARRPA